MGLSVWAPELSEHADDPHHPRCVLQGLQEFREHLGGELTIILLKDIGQSITVNKIDETLMVKSINFLQRISADRFEKSSLLMPSAGVCCTGD